MTPLFRMIRWKQAAMLAAGVAGLLLLIAACSGESNDPTATADEQATTVSTATPSPTSTTGDSDAGDRADQRSETPTPTEFIEPEIGPNGLYLEVQISDAGTKHLLPWTRVQSGGVGKDGIPSFDDPKFATKEEWRFLNYRPEDFVVGVEVDGVRRAYPFQIIAWHEIVNDTINGKPILISYCPLCGTAIAFERELDGEALEFGVSGLLYNSDLLMYDRTHNNLWSQIHGIAVVGDQTGEQLAFYPSEIMTWLDWQRSYPDSEVLTRDTGHGRNYNGYAYPAYDERDEINFPVNFRDDRLHTKTRVTGVTITDGVYGAYGDEDVLKHGPINDTLDDVPLLVAANPHAGGNVVVFDRRAGDRELIFSAGDGVLIDDQTGSTWDYSGLAVDGALAGTQLEEIIPVKGFWFAWFAFHPGTELWHMPEESGQ